MVSLMDSELSGMKMEQGKNTALLKKNKLNGLWTSWFSNGNKKAEGKYIQGREDGVHSQWYSNGEIKSKAKRIYYGKYQWFKN